DGTALWEFRPASPVWNMVPQYGKDGDTVMFSDFEGTAYCLDIQTGALQWQHDGAMGTYTQSFALYLAAADLLYTMGLKNEGSYSYEHKNCNPFPAPGILPACGTWPGSPGWAKALNASSGRTRWELDLAEPPAAAGLGEMHQGASRGTRLIIATGHNCMYGSKSRIYAVDPTVGNTYWEKDGPTLWTNQCAGDFEGADIRRAMGGRASCHPSSWSMPAMDTNGDLYVGSQVGELQRWGTEDGTHGARKIELLSTLTTGVAFQDFGGPGVRPGHHGRCDVHVAHRLQHERRRVPHRLRRLGADAVEAEQQQRVPLFPRQQPELSSRARRSPRAVAARLGAIRWRPGPFPFGSDSASRSNSRPARTRARQAAARGHGSNGGMGLALQLLGREFSVQQLRHQLHGDLALRCLCRRCLFKEQLALAVKACWVHGSAGPEPPWLANCSPELAALPLSHSSSPSFFEEESSAPVL
ncbi:unnamed protein product, partial [Prorocentrum cordatum]